MTADVTAFLTAQSPAYKIALTNSIIRGALGDASTVITQNVSLNPPATVFQKASYGNYYLASGSPCQGAGTTNISARLSSELRHKTTCPPMALPAFMHLSGEMTLLPQARRYTGAAPDIGFWYDALDYSVGNVSVAGGKVTVEPGTAIAVRNEYLPASDSWTSVGFYVKQGSAFISHGTPTRPNIFTAEKMVQETPEADFSALQVLIDQYAGFWYAGSVSFIPDYEPVDDTTPAPILDFRSSQFFLPSADYHLWSGLNEFPLFGGADIETSFDSAMYLTLQDCSVYGGRINLGSPDYMSLPPDQVYAPGSVTWANTLFDRVAINLDPTFYRFGYRTNVDLAFHAYNNLFKEGLWFLIEQIPASAGNWKFTDNLFDKVDFIQNTNLPLDLAYNAYWAKQPSELFWPPIDVVRLLPTATGGGQNEQVLAAAPPYQTGPLGNYYLPTTTPLYHAGSRSATNAGLFHYTTRIDQTKEGDELSEHMVNIGLHYIATTNGVPKDSDGDGIPDYVENASGTGAVGANETDWQTAYTVSGVSDPTNSVYDDIDLSGDGLVGRVKKALGISPFDTSNPFTPMQVITGEEPDIATFRVPVSYGTLTNIGQLQLYADGIAVPFQECTPDTNGNCLLLWNTTYNWPGQHFLQAQISLNGQLVQGATPDPTVLTGFGSLAPFYSYNTAKFDPFYAEYDLAGAILYAELPEPDANYSIELRTPSGQHIKTIAGSTSSGVIKEPWDLTDESTNAYTGDSVDAVFSVTLANSARSGTNTQPISLVDQWMLADGNVTVAYAWDIDSFAQGAMRDCVQWGIVDELIKPGWIGGMNPNPYHSTFNDYSWSGGRGIPGYLSSSNAVSQLTNNLADPQTMNFQFTGHGSEHTIGNGKGDKDPALLSIASGAIAEMLGNKFLPKHGPKRQHPYRFVFLDACETAKAPFWSQAFGVLPRITTAQLADRPMKVQAFVGWYGSPRAPNSTGEFYDEAVTFAVFYSAWMNGFTLDGCIFYASGPHPLPPFEPTTLNFPLGIKFP